MPLAVPPPSVLSPSAEPQALRPWREFAYTFAKGGSEGSSPAAGALPRPPGCPPPGDRGHCLRSDLPGPAFADQGPAAVSGHSSKSTTMAKYVSVK